MIYVVPENCAPYDSNDWRNVLKCSEHPDFSCSFPGRNFEVEMAGLPGNSTPVGWLITEANNHMQRSHVVLPANLN